jgi:hypothetical protein
MATAAESRSPTKADLEWMTESLTAAHVEVIRAVNHALGVVHDVSGVPADLRRDSVRTVEALEACQADLKRLCRRTEDIDPPQSGQL